MGKRRGAWSAAQAGQLCGCRPAALLCAPDGDPPGGPRLAVAHARQAEGRLLQPHAALLVQCCRDQRVALAIGPLPHRGGHVKAQGVCRPGGAGALLSACVQYRRAAGSRRPGSCGGARTAPPPHSSSASPPWNSSHRSAARAVQYWWDCRYWRSAARKGSCGTGGGGRGWFLQAVCKCLLRLARPQASRPAPLQARLLRRAPRRRLISWHRHVLVVTVGPGPQHAQHTGACGGAAGGPSVRLSWAGRQRQTAAARQPARV